MFYFGNLCDVETQLILMFSKLNLATLFFICKALQFKTIQA